MTRTNLAAFKTRSARRCRKPSARQTWRKVESRKLLGEVGNDWLNIPVINYTEFGNLKDSMVPWLRRADGSFAFDYSRLDRYLDLAVKHLGRPRVINFVIMHGTVGDPADVQVRDEKTGQEVTLKLGNRDPDYQAAWKAFASSLYEYMRGRGLEKSIYYGFFWDSVADMELPPLLAGVTPGVLWTSGAHRGKEHYFVGAYSQLLPFHLTEQSAMGWRKDDFHVLLPRGGGSLIAGPGTSFPMNFRIMVDRSLAVGMNGVGRMGADYWGDSYTKGMRQEGFLRAGMPNHYMLWPGPAGAESSARFAALREGLQEAEARIYLEQLLVRAAGGRAAGPAPAARPALALPEELASRIRQVLYEHHRGTLFVPSMDAGWLYVEQCRDWQDRSRRLLATAAAAAKVVGLDLRQERLDLNLPARAKSVQTLKIRNWCGQRRQWKLDVQQGPPTRAEEFKWILPARTSGECDAHQDLAVTLDTSALPPGQTATGSLTFTDVQAGTSVVVPVTARVGGVLECLLSYASLDRKQVRFVPDDGREVLNAVPGQPASRALALMNRSGGEVSFQASASLPWLSVEPGSGKAAANALVELKLTARPAGEHAGRHEAVVTVVETGGGALDPAKLEIPLAVYVLAPHRPPPAMPKGQPALLDAALHQSLLVSRAEWRAPWCAHEIIGFAASTDQKKLGKDGSERGQPVENVFTAPAPQQTVYKLEGKGFNAFSARVDLPRDIAGYKYWDAGSDPPPEWVRVRFEIYVDGKLRAASDFLSVKDDPQALVVEGLESAKELRLVTRFEKFPPCPVTAAWWDARFHN